MKTNALLILLLFGTIVGCKKPYCPDPIVDSPPNSISGWNSKISGISGDLISVDFPSLTTGYITGTNGTVYKTIDKGASFQNISPTAGNDYYALDFISETTGYIGNNNGLVGGNVYKTNDGGQNWQTLTIPAHIWRCIKFIDANVGFAGGGVNNDVPAYVGKLYRTADGGISWTEIVISNLKTVRSIYFLDGNNGYMCADQQQFYKTTDGGLTWTTKTFNLPTLIPNSQLISAAIYFKDINNGFSITNTVFHNDVFMMKTTDGGDNWSRVTLPQGGLSTENYYLSMCFSDNSIGYITGGNVAANKGSILKTVDGGATWNSMSISTPRLFKMSLIDSTNAFAVGLSGTVLKSK